MMSRNGSEKADAAVGIVRESGMPPVEYWSTFFEPSGLLDEMAIVDAKHLAELGAGYGLFTIPLSDRCDRLTTFELDSALCCELRTELQLRGTKNVDVVEDDFFDDQLLNSKGPFDAVVLFNIVHMEDPPQLIRKLRSVMRPSGLVYLLHWRTDIETPRGPSLEIRSSPQQCREWFSQCGFRCTTELLPASAPYHFAQVYTIVTGHNNELV